MNAVRGYCITGAGYDRGASEGPVFADPDWRTAGDSLLTPWYTSHTRTCDNKIDEVTSMLERVMNDWLERARYSLTRDWENRSGSLSDSLIHFHARTCDNTMLSVRGYCNTRDSSERGADENAVLAVPGLGEPQGIHLELPDI